MVIPRLKAKLGELSVTIVPFNSDGIERKTLSTKEITRVTFHNINESNLSNFLKFEIWQGGEQLRSFLVKVEIEGMPETRVSQILRSIINSRDRFFEYLRFLLADDNDKDPIGSDDDERKSGDGDGSDIWDSSKPIFEQLLLSASRSPQRLKAIDGVIEQLQKDDDGSASDIVPVEFLEFWQAFKQIVPQRKRRNRK